MSYSQIYASSDLFNKSLFIVSRTRNECNIIEFLSVAIVYDLDRLPFRHRYRPDDVSERQFTCMNSLFIIIMLYYRV